MATPIAEAVVELRATTKQLTADLAKVRAQMANTANNGEKAFAGMFATVKKLAGPMSAIFSVGAATQFSRTVINTAARFEQSMANVKAISGATGAAFMSMESAAKEMGRTTKFTATESANALQFLTMAGLSARDSVAALPGVLSLAAAGGIDIALAADLATNVLGGMRLEVEDLSKVNDILAMTTSKSNTNIVELSNALRIAGPVAAATGHTIDEVSAVLGGMANQGIKAENAGQGLKQMYARLTMAARGGSEALDENGESVGKVGDAIAELGVNILDSNGKMRNMSAILSDLNAAGMDAGQAMNIFGKYTFATALAATSASKSILDIKESLQGAKGAAERMAKIRLETFEGAVTILGSAFESLLISMGDTVIKSKGVNDAIKRLTISFTDAANEIERTGSIFGEWGDEVAAAFDIAAAALVVWVANIALTSSAVAGLVSMLATLATGFTAVGTAVSVLLTGGSATFGLLEVIALVAASAIGVMVAGLAAVVSTTGYVIVKFEELQSAWEDYDKSVARGVDLDKGLKDMVFALAAEGKEVANLRNLIDTGTLTAQEYFRVKEIAAAAAGKHSVALKEESKLTGLLKAAQKAYTDSTISETEKRVSAVKSAAAAKVVAVKKELGQELLAAKDNNKKIASAKKQATAAIKLIEKHAAVEISKIHKDEQDERTKAAEDAEKERLRITERFADDYNKVTQSTYEYGLDTLDKQYDEYATHVEDKNKLDEWYYGELEKLVEGQLKVEGKGEKDSASDIRAARLEKEREAQLYASSIGKLMGSLAGGSSEAWSSMATDGVEAFNVLAGNTEVSAGQAAAAVANAVATSLAAQKQIGSGKIDRTSGIAMGAASGAAAGAAVGSGIGAVVGAIAGGALAASAPDPDTGAKYEHGLGKINTLIGNATQSMRSYAAMFSEAFSEGRADVLMKITGQFAELADGIIDTSLMSDELKSKWQDLAHAGAGDLSEQINVFGVNSNIVRNTMEGMSKNAGQLALDFAAVGQAGMEWAQTAADIAVAMNRDGVELAKNILGYTDLIDKIAAVDERTRGLTNATAAQTLADNMLANAQLFSVEQLQQAAGASQRLSDIQNEQKDITTQLANANNLSASEVERLKQRLQELSTESEGIEKNLTGMKDGTTALTSAEKELMTWTGELKAAQNELASIQKKLGDEANLSATDIENLRKRSGELENTIGDLNGKIDTAKIGITETGDAAADASLTPFETAVDKLAIALDKIIIKLNGIGTRRRLDYEIHTNYTSSGSPAGSANGNAFSTNGIVPFASGGVVKRPTLFSFAGGKMGVMGEAGDEGILPLKRNKQGKLGVMAEGTGGGVTINVNGSLVAQAELMDIIENALNKRARLTHA